MPQLLLAALDAGVAGGSELILELLDAAGRIDELQFARVEGMADAADIDLELLASAARGELIAATAGNLCFVVFGMDAVFHGRPSLVHILCSPKVYGERPGLTSGVARINRLGEMETSFIRASTKTLLTNQAKEEVLGDGVDAVHVDDVFAEAHLGQDVRAVGELTNRDLAGGELAGAEE
jgi:hypothetical protein